MEKTSVIAVLMVGIILGILVANAILCFSGSYEKITYTYDKLKEWEFNCVK